MLAMTTCSASRFRGARIEANRDVHPARVRSHASPSMSSAFPSAVLGSMRMPSSIDCCGASATVVSMRDPSIRHVRWAVTCTVDT